MPVPKVKVEALRANLVQVKREPAEDHLDELPAKQELPEPEEESEQSQGTAVRVKKEPEEESEQSQGTAPRRRVTSKMQPLSVRLGCPAQQAARHEEDTIPAAIPGPPTWQCVALTTNLLTTQDILEHVPSPGSPASSSLSLGHDEEERDVQMHEESLGMASLDIPSPRACKEAPGRQKRPPTRHLCGISKKIATKKRDAAK